MTILLAVALSLASTNDYLFSTPFSTNVVGVGIGEDLDYRVPRSEDKMFLWEAHMERGELLDWLSESAVTTKTPVARGPYTGWDTNAVPNRYTFEDALLRFYDPNVYGAFGCLTNGHPLAAVSFDNSRAIGSMLVVTNASLYSNPRDAIPFVFQGRNPDADRSFIRSFDTNLNFVALAMTANPYTNAYHDIIRNDALTWYQVCRGRTGAVDPETSVRRYTRYPVSFDPQSGAVYRQNETREYTTTNNTPYAQIAPMVSVAATCYKVGFSYYDRGNRVGGDDGTELIASETAEKPLSTCSVTFSRPLGNAEPVEAKCFALVLFSSRGYVKEHTSPSQDKYSKSASLVCPVQCGPFYVTDDDLYAVDVRIDIDQIAEQAMSLLGESWPDPNETSGWIEGPPRPESGVEGFSGLVSGQWNTAFANASVRIWHVIGFAKFRFNARTERNNQ